MRAERGQRGGGRLRRGDASPKRGHQAVCPHQPILTGGVDLETGALQLPADATLEPCSYATLMLPPPPPPSRATLNFQNVMEPTPPVAPTRALFVRAVRRHKR